MNLYVWRGERVLKNYRSGLVVVAANTVEHAWDKLAEGDLRAFWCLRHGIKHVFDPTDVALLSPDDYPDDWVISQPEVFTVETLPVLVMQGGE